MVDTIKFSEFFDGGDLEPDQTTVGLEAGVNTRFTNPFPLLPPGSTGDRPAIAASMYYRLRFNTSLESYEYYSPTEADWIQLEDSTDIAILLALLASHLAGEGASLIGLENQGTIVDKTVQDLANASLVANTDNGTLVNGQFLEDLSTGIVKNTTTTGILSILTGSSTISAVINDNTMATAATTNIPTSSSIKTYVQTQVQQSAFNHGLDTGVADAYIVNLTPAITGLTDGLLLSFNPVNANLTRTPTLTVNGFTANIVTMAGISLAPSDLGNGPISFLIYNLTQGYWQLLNATISNAAAAFIQNSLYISGTDSGAANAYVFSFDAGGSGFSPGIGTSIAFIPDNNNTTASTITVQGAGPASIILMNGATLPAGALLTTKYAYLVYGINTAGALGWILMNPQGYTASGIWVDQTTTPITMTTNRGYTSNAGASLINFALPTTSAVGDFVEVNGKGSGLWTISQAAGQQIQGAFPTTLGAGGSLSSILQYDCIRLRCITANTIWVVASAFGNFTVV